ncbi:RAD52 family DNA repair protein [Synechococcus sp. RS9907]|uniref:RAD52 family DNA repair protein n=1 Tax=Synechococcus sp. RS9907 TaxID=221350 RepID=UPI002106DCFF|nr:RAD52 family DNA repair protein [Synechococcus sp. RS9907]
MRSSSPAAAGESVNPAHPLSTVLLSPSNAMHTTTAGFSPEQLAALSAPLDRAKVQTRQQAGRSLAYLEGWQAIAEANRIFGFDGWQRETIALACVNQSERSIGRDGRSGWGVTYTARVRIRVGAVIREGSGAGHGIDADLGQAHESALKEAETDAMKRALMTFGNPFGLALYDKQQRQVTSPSSSTPPNTRHRLTAQRPGAVSNAKAEGGLEPLDAATVQTILATVRRLPRPELEGFTKAFRKRFQVPAEATSIADRINQRRHHDWIEAFLLQHRPRTVAATSG